ncbi:atypical/ABC1/ABC1-B protein kinase [Salpingoeca rosetta]|uniref:Atypical/ABC1/ABC1-B protein kinase n=1 Tax=Salpingoeca rosetta (strain ATCC 50818 / BSB-021) TaxID=946362 RepID=F2UQA3_SALR5|nr:atypical/ABC1/ABC1-B protein kinase [Salpingoeca rosetta]EGD79771.1 atypical/ABC1/ABC1-B protein kinase [Salpingoeca rosetta]|eukprot:XP_004988720.1 atypical/ABC1/ABC1-B protein kinase [Salpingoeca rosetta]
MSRSTLWRRAGAVLAVGAVAAHQYDTHFRYECFNRSMRTAVAAVQTVWDYKVVLDRHPDMISDIHARVARRWYNICCKNAGLYIKLGQSISMQNHVLPPEYAELFANLQDKAPTVSYEEVCAVMREDFGKEPEEIFAEFDKEAIASASIAQIHKAKLKDGTAVAVKVQKPNIRYQMPWDLLCYRVLVWCFEKAFDLPMYFTVNHVCESVSKEADFLCEATFTERARRDLVGTVPRVYVPHIHRDLTRRRIMTMEWIDGVKLSRHGDIAAMGFSLKAVMTTVFKAFAHQIFLAGFVHGDPHPGNLLIRPNPTNPRDFELVVIDHGLYVPERPEFREQYCRLWTAMVLTDFDELKSVCVDWGITDPELFASMQLFRPFKANKKAVHVAKVTRTDLLALQLRAKERVKALLADTSKLPLELIILARTMNILRGLNKQAGSIINRINLFALTAVEGLHAEEASRARKFRRASFQLRLWFIEAVYYATNLVSRVREWLGYSSSRFENVLETTMTQSLEQRLGFKVGVRDTDLG